MVILGASIFGKVTARVHIDSAIYPNLNNAMSCYYGSFGSNNNCTIVKNDGVISAKPAWAQVRQ